MFRDMIDTKVRSFERKLGAVFLPILRELEMELGKDSK